ncbi:hypothetical protein, partial [Bacteroides heparinolyticus]|uniref:hypothetical protein n=1 Tax=Prevotella heparinolytica TaxID=28113 RepID=UPI0023F7C21D
KSTQKNVDNLWTKLVNTIWTKRGNRIVPKMGKSCLAKRVKVAWLFQLSSKRLAAPTFFVRGSPELPLPLTTNNRARHDTRA